jgi:hypothetical protein
MNKWDPTLGLTPARGADDIPRGFRVADKGE